MGSSFTVALERLMGDHTLMMYRTSHRGTYLAFDDDDRLRCRDAYGDMPVVILEDDLMADD